MDRCKLTVGIEPTNKYDKAKQDVIQAINSIQELTQQEQQMLVTELFGAAGISAVLSLFYRY